MAPEEAQTHAPRRRGRPPGSKNRRPRRSRAGGGDLVAQLNAMVAELIKKNKQLQRQVAKLTEKAGASSATKGVERGIRTLSRRVQKALGSEPKRRRRTAASNGRRKRTAATRRRKAS
jgi:uncharacterized coiled-coil protein SlyX